MPTLKYAVATPRDVIAHAFAQSPYTFIIKMNSLAEMHADQAAKPMSWPSRRAALDLGKACAECARMLSTLLANPDDDALDRIMAEMRLWLPCYGAACSLLHVPRLAQHDIVVRWEAARRSS